MKVIKNKQITEDQWQRINDDEALPTTGDVIVSFARWQAESDQLKSRADKIGILLNGDDDLEALAGDLGQIDTVALNFPAYKDGRGYSLARILRDRYQYKGDIRAVGDVLRDQLFYMHRVGINVFQMREDQDIESSLAAFETFSVKYQPAADEAEPLYRRL